MNVYTPLTSAQFWSERGRWSDEGDLGWSGQLMAALGIVAAQLNRTSVAVRNISAVLELAYPVVIK